MNEIKPGDVVRLKSGSKPMTVESVEGGQVYVVAERDGALIRSQVNLAALEASTPNRTGGYIRIG